jgi:hypothetical protein
MWPKSHTNGLMSGEWQRSRLRSLMGAISAFVLVRTASRASRAASTLVWD